MCDTRRRQRAQRPETNNLKTPTKMKTFSYATDSENGTINAASLAEAYATLRARITDAMIEDGATLWVEDTDTGERETMPTPRS